MRLKHNILAVCALALCALAGGAFLGTAAVSAGGLPCWFNHLDTDKDGFVTANEVKAAHKDCKGWDGAAGDTEAAAWVKERDTNSDSKVTLTELIAHDGKAEGETTVRPNANQAKPEVKEADAAANAAASSPKVWDGKSYAVHEWGTFTFVQGSDSSVVDGLYHHERDLPKFVHDLTEQRPVRARRCKGETPVIYFYSPEKASVRVNVKVDFPHGIMTQWYPIASRANFATDDISTVRRAPITSLRDGFVCWDNSLQILPTGAKAELPEVAKDDPWRFCREVDANNLSVPSHGGRESEKFLFYRGLGDFPQPVSVSVASESEILWSKGTGCRDVCYVDMTVNCTIPGQTLEHVYVVCVKDGKCGFTYVQEVNPALPAKGWPPPMASYTFGCKNCVLNMEPLTESTEELVKHLTESLTKTGLYEKEALAMARTWQHGYFQDEGLRVLYIMPNAVVDKELPLTVTGFGALGSDGKRAAAPITRTFVGRIEALSPQREAAIELTVKDYASSDANAQARAKKTVDKWGRLAIPYLNRVCAITKSEQVKQTAQALLKELDPITNLNSGMNPKPAPSAPAAEAAKR